MQNKYDMMRIVNESINLFY